MSIKKKGIINITFIYIGIFVGFLNTIIKARALTREEIGVFSILITLTTIAGYIIKIGTPIGMVKYRPQFSGRPSEESGFFLFNLLFNLGIALAIFGLFFQFRQQIINLYDNRLIATYINYTALYILISIFLDYLNAVFIANSRVQTATFIFDVLGRLLRTAVFLYILLTESSLSLYLCLEAVILLIQTCCFLLLSKVRRVKRPSFGFLSKSFFYEYLIFIVTMFSASLVTILINSIDKLMVGYFISVDAVGLYTISIIFVAFIRAISKGFAKIGQPVIAEYWKNDDIHGIEKIYKENLNLQLFLSLFVYVLFVLFGRQVLTIVGEDYRAGYYIMLIISAGEMLNIGTGLCGAIINYSKYYKVELYTKLFLVIVSVLTNLIFIPRWGVEGAAFATALSLGLYNIIKVIFVSAKMGIHPYDGKTIVILIHSVMFFVLLKIFTFYYIPGGFISILIVCAAALLVYMGTSAAFRLPFARQFISYTKLVAKR